MMMCAIRDRRALFIYPDSRIFVGIKPVSHQMAAGH